MLYFIGGKSQAGKSEISKEIKKCVPDLIVIEADNYRDWTKPDPDEYGWIRVLDYLKSNGSKGDILVEGVVVTPEHVKELESYYKLKAVFIGFGNEDYVNVWLRYAKENPRGYLAREEIRRKNAGEISQFAAFPEEVKDSKNIQKRSEKLGYRYFAMTEPPSFQKRIQPIIDYLLSS